MVQINPMSAGKAFNLHLFDLLFAEDVRMSGDVLQLLPWSSRPANPRHNLRKPDGYLFTYRFIKSVPDEHQLSGLKS